MTLFGTILRKVQSHDSISKKYSTSPPPENAEVIQTKKKKKYVDKFRHVSARVDSAPPQLQPLRMYRNMSLWSTQFRSLYLENVRMLTLIKRQHFLRGRVDCHWDHPQYPSLQSYHERKQFYRRLQNDNKYLYKNILNTKARVTTTESMQRDWARNRRMIIQRAEKEFVLFEPVPKEHIEDVAFSLPVGVKRPRVHLQLGVVGAALLGELVVELFTDVCPLTCQLFLDLIDGDGLGHGYVGTYFFTKVPTLYWAGGDVIFNNGFGCYAQRGRRVPIGAENYHYPHSMPGLLSMRMTPNNEMCGIFNITFKALPQFDLRNVVFGRVVRPCSTYDTIRHLGSPLSTQPVVAITRARRRVDSRWVCGQPNTRFIRTRY